MARPLRIQYAGAIYHVMNRGTDRRPIFIDESGDRALFLSTVGDAVAFWKIRVHAYALMPNHYHLLVETPLGNLSRAMRHIDGLYTQRLNKSLGRDGPLFRGRFKSILVQRESYFLELVRYIHLNGVRANLYPNPQADPFGSHAAYMNPHAAPTWLDQETVLRYFSADATDPRQALDRFVRQGISTELAATLEKKRWPAILGAKDFIEKIRKEYVESRGPHEDIPQQNGVLRGSPPAADAIVAAVCQEYGVPASSVTAPFRKAFKEFRWCLIFALRRCGLLTYRRIAGILGGGMRTNSILLFLKNNNYQNSFHVKRTLRRFTSDGLRPGDLTPAAARSASGSPKE